MQSNVVRFRITFCVAREVRYSLSQNGCRDGGFRSKVHVKLKSLLQKMNSFHTVITK